MRRKYSNLWKLYFCYYIEINGLLLCLYDLKLSYNLVILVILIIDLDNYIVDLYDLVEIGC